ncbi:Signal recognition particle [Dimargaris xerosporica]|nr:Signal recognition particle [Dimargaris xerosporica]
MERFQARPFISKMLGMGDLGQLVETVQDLKLDQNPDFIKRVSQGVFTLRDLRDQLQNVMKMGPLSKILGMMPGMPSDLLKGSEEEGSKQLKGFMTIMDSMTDKELDSDGKIFVDEPSRIMRVARGSGSHPHIVMELLAQAKSFSQMIKKMGGSKGLLKGMDPKMLSKAGLGHGRMPNLSASQMARAQQQMSKMMPANLMQQMGGMSGIQNMMQQFMGGGGMPNMQEMMKQMGGLGGLGGDFDSGGGSSSSPKSSGRRRK